VKYCLKTLKIDVYRYITATYSSTVWGDWDSRNVETNRIGVKIISV